MDILSAIPSENIHKGTNIIVIKKPRCCIRGIKSRILLEKLFRIPACLSMVLPQQPCDLIAVDVPIGNRG